MICRASCSIDLMIASDGTNSEMCSELIYIDDTDECYYTTHV